MLSARNWIPSGNRIPEDLRYRTSLVFCWTSGRTPHFVPSPLLIYLFRWLWLSQSPPPSPAALTGASCVWKRVTLCALVTPPTLCPRGQCRRRPTFAPTRSKRGSWEKRTEYCSSTGDCRTWPRSGPKLSTRLSKNSLHTRIVSVSIVSSDSLVKKPSKCSRSKSVPIWFLQGNLWCLSSGIVFNGSRAYRGSYLLTPHKVLRQVCNMWTGQYIQY